MAHEREYSDDNLEFVKQAYFEQLHLAVLSALEEGKKNYKVSSGSFNFSWFFKLRIGDFARGWHLDRTKYAPEPQELGVDEAFAGSALEATINYMSFDDDFKAIADIVGKIQDLKTSGEYINWSNRIKRLTKKAIKNPILKARFCTMEVFFSPEQSDESVADVIDYARFSYPEMVRSGAFPFNASVQKAARLANKSQAASKSSSHSILSCFNFSSTPKYQVLRERDDSFSSESSQSTVDDSIVGQATKIFAQYFENRGMKGAWSPTKKGDEIPFRFQSQHTAAKEVLSSLRFESTVTALNLNNAICSIARMAELMYDATQRQGFGAFVPFKPSQFAKTLKSVAVVLANSFSSNPKFDEQFAKTRLALSRRHGVKYAAITAAKKEFEDHKVELSWRPMETHHVAIHKSAIKAAKADALKQLGVNMCFDLISSAIKWSQVSAVEVPRSDIISPVANLPQDLSEQASRPGSDSSGTYAANNIRCLS
jgi:hypothetical protein